MRFPVSRVSYEPGSYHLTEAKSAENDFMSPQMSHLFKKAQSERNRALKERDTEDAVDVIRKLMKGYTITEEQKTYQIVTGYTGNEILIPVSNTIREKHFQPNLGAAIYMSANRDPTNWKRHTPFEDLFKDKVKPEDMFDRMSDDELTAYIAKADKALK